MDRTAPRKSEERYRRVLDGIMEGCQIIGPDWEYVYVNDAAALGANVFGGQRDWTSFGRFEKDDNVYLSVRFDFS